MDIHKKDETIGMAEETLRDWFNSKYLQKQQAAMYNAFCLVPEKIGINDDRSVIISEWEKENTL